MLRLEALKRLKTILGPDAGIIERDEEGNVTNVILEKVMN